MVALIGLTMSNRYNLLCQTSNIPSVSNSGSAFIQINGKSNLNQFYFAYYSNHPMEIKDSYYSKDSGAIEIRIPVRDFKASNPLMYNDFIKVLKARDFPYIKISLSGYQMVWRNTGSDTPRLQIAITIAGKTSVYQVTCSINHYPDKLMIDGSKKIRFTDFNLAPPERLNGLIKVQDEIMINFGLIVNFIQQKPSLT